MRLWGVGGRRGTPGWCEKCGCVYLGVGVDGLGVWDWVVWGVGSGVWERGGVEGWQLTVETPPNASC